MAGLREIPEIIHLPRILTRDLHQVCQDQVVDRHLHLHLHNNKDMEVRMDMIGIKPLGMDMEATTITQIKAVVVKIKVIMEVRGRISLTAAMDSINRMADEASVMVITRVKVKVEDILQETTGVGIMAAGTIRVVIAEDNS